VGDPVVGSLSPASLRRALDALPDGVVVFRADWTVAYVNSAGAELLHRRPADVVGRSLWVALPELVGGIFHSLLLNARTSASPVSWVGYFPPAARWLSARAVLVDGLLLVTLRTEDREGAERDISGAGTRLHRGRPDDGSSGDMDGDTEGEADRLGLLAEVSEAMIATLDTGQSAARLAELAAGRLCDWAVVALAGPDGRPDEEAWAHRDPARRADLDTYMAGRLTDTGDDAAMIDALLTGEPVQVVPIREGAVARSLVTDEVRAAWERLNATSCTIVPLRARGETFGALALLNAGERPPHTPWQIATAMEVARRGALALDNARLYGRQHAVAEKLQISLLTEPPQPDDLEIAVRYRPASSHMHVGGDWYDAFAQPDGATMLVIGDVVGHDLDAAAAMGQIRSMLRGLAYDRPASPARILARVDNVLAGLDVDHLATALVARIEQPTDQAARGLRTLRWSSAGHLWPLLLHADGSVQILESRPERLLGTDNPGARSNHQATLYPDDTLLLYTDGLVEHGRTGLDEGIARLAAAAADLHPLPLEEYCDQLLDRLLPTRPDDDVAILAIRCHPQQRPADTACT
jgi:sigma-B regulation protein RsbU (phosphoserine phosphatase)